VQVQVRNRTLQPVVLPAEVLSAAQLLLEVIDARGTRVPTVPPPAMSGQAVTLAPGERVRRELTLDVFSPPLRPGRYTVRFRGAVIVGTPVTFVVDMVRAS
jgi:hypothetical protein